MTSKKYYTLIGKDAQFHKGDAYVIIFGDYKRQVVVDEKEDTDDYYYDLKIIKTDDGQEAIDKAVKELNDKLQIGDTP